MSKEHESQLKRLREIIGVYGGEIHRLEKQNEEYFKALLEIAKSIHLKYDYDSLIDTIEIHSKMLLEKIKQKPIEEILKEV